MVNWRPNSLSPASSTPHISSASAMSPPPITSRCSQLSKTELTNRALGGRSFSSDITNRREAPSSCAGSPAQAFEGEVGEATSVYHASCDPTAFLIDTPAIRIRPNSIDCIAGARSNRHLSGPLQLLQISKNRRKSRSRFDGFSSCSAGLSVNATRCMPRNVPRLVQCAFPGLRKRRNRRMKGTNTWREKFPRRLT